MSDGAHILTDEELDRKARIIAEYYSRADSRMKDEGKTLFFDTEKGIWGPSDIAACFSIFKKMNLEKRNGFCDLGSGDARIIFVASLFTKSTGVESDNALCTLSNKIKIELNRKIPSLSDCEIINGDYCSMDLSKYDVLFIFADHSWSEDFEKRLQSNWRGIILSYRDIFRPRLIKKGKTFWEGQIKIVTYPVNDPVNIADDSFSS